MGERDWERIGEAVVAWTGWGRFPFPRREESLLIERFGPDATAELLPIVRELEGDFYASDARHRARDLTEMGEMVAREFRERHPELGSTAIDALAWCYTFDYK